MAVSSFNRSQVTYPAGIQNICDFRLTLVTGTPVMTSSQTGITTVYMTPYKGSEIALYDGTNWNLRSTTEISASLAGLTASKNYDVWCYDNGGTPTLELLVWTNDSTRATALTTQNGVYCKTGAVTRRYMGTIRINSTGGQCNYVFGSTASKGGAGDLGVWNYYNRCQTTSITTDSDNSWTTTSGTPNTLNASTTNRCSFVVGVAEDAVEAAYSGYQTNSGSGSLSIGLNVTNAYSGTAMIAGAADGGTSIAKSIVAAGYNYYQALQAANSGTATSYGDNGNATIWQTGLVVSIFN